ncbi:MAG: M43 family zinc metalloprotease [Cyclobacteriaceae bacterium]
MWRKSLLFILPFISSCEEMEIALINSKEYYIHPNAYYMVADGESKLVLNVIQMDVNYFKGKFSSINNIKLVENNTITYYHNGEPINGYNFVTTETGEHVFRAEYNGWVSDDVTVVARAQKNYELISIPLIFHVVYDDEPVGEGANISKDSIDRIVSLVNLRFRKNYYNLNYPETTQSPNHIDSKIEFRLAQYDPKGNILEETGIKRYGGYKNISGDIISKIQGDNMWSPHLYINITIAPDNTGVSGGTSLPFSDEAYLACGLYTSSSIYGVSSTTWDIFLEEMHKKNFINVNHGIYLPIRMLNDWTLTHELGHYFGLLHVFNPISCTDLDCAEDTQYYNKKDYYPSKKRFGIFYDCNTGYIITHDNYMGGAPEERDYIHANVPYYYGFTYDQRDRMREVLEYSPWIKDLKYSLK